MSDTKKVGRKPKKHWQVEKELEVYNQDPKFTYKWIKKNRLGRRSRNWETCKVSIDGSKGLSTSETEENDMYMSKGPGEDLVLCKMPIHMKKEREELMESQNKFQAGEALKEFQSTATQAGMELDDKEYTNEEKEGN